MQVVHQKPPEWLWKRCEEQFGATFEKGAIYTLGTQIFAKDPIPEDWLVHEKVHVDQQELFKSPEEWWERYFTDRIFRMNQELAAYRAQYEFIASYCKAEEQLHKACWKLAGEFSTIYKLEINRLQAYKLIKNK